jgi:peptide/nickel transport system permease protein
VVLFVLLRLLPGDPANALLGVGATEQQIAAARAQVGSDQPLYLQFVGFIGNLARLDLGTSFVSRASVLGEIGNRMSVTLPLTFLGFLVALMLAIPLGILSAVRSSTWYGNAISIVSQLGIAIPVFWVGILLVTLFSINLRWLPSGGFPLKGWTNFGEALVGMILPALTIGLVMGASLLRYARAATLDVLGSDFLRTARALGSSFPEALVMASAMARSRSFPSWASSLRAPFSAPSLSSASSACRALAPCCCSPSSSVTIPMCRAFSSSRPCWCCSSALPQISPSASSTRACAAG